MRRHFAWENLKVLVLRLTLMGVEQLQCRLRLMRELLLSVNVYLTPGFVRAMKNCHVCVPRTSFSPLSPLSVSYIRSKT